MTINRLLGYVVIIMAWIAVGFPILLGMFMNRAVFSPEGMETNLVLYYGTVIGIVAWAFIGPFMAIAFSEMTNDR